jgi:hypothetical protein
MLVWRTRRFTTYARGIYERLHQRQQTFNEEHKFLDFCNSMNKLQRIADSRESLRVSRDHQLRMSVLTSKEPFREILENYLQVRKEVDGEQLATTLGWLSRLFEVKNPQGYLDITKDELFDSWQFEEILLDIRQAFATKIFLGPPQLAEIAESFSRLGYKDQELWSTLLDKVARMLKDPVTEGRMQGELGGFQENAEFQKYLATLVEWKIPSKKEVPTDPILKQLDELEVLVKRSKVLQLRFASALVNVRSYYFHIISTLDGAELLKNNNELRVMIAHLHEVLVESGLVDPIEFTSIKNFDSLEARMEGAEQAFTQLVNEVYPGLKSDSIDAYADAIELFERLDIPLEGFTKLPVKTFGLEFLGRIVGALAESMHSPTRTVNGPDFTTPVLAEYAASLPAARLREDLNYLLVNPELTAFWKYGHSVATEFIEHAELMIGEANLAGLCQAAFGFAEARVGDVQFYRKIASAMLKAPGTADADTLGRGLYGLKAGGAITGAAVDKLSSLLAESQDLEQMRFTELLRAVWALAHEGKYNLHFRSVYSELNSRSPANVPRAAGSLANDVAYAISVDAPDSISALSPHLYGQVDSLLHSLKPTSLDPLKPLLAKAVKGHLYRGLTEAEVKDLDKQAEAYPKLFDWDALVFLNGHKVPVYILGEDGFYGDSLLGHYRCRFKFLERDGFTALALPIHKLVEVDWNKPSFELLDFSFIDDLVKIEVGPPLSCLEPIEGVLNDMLSDLKDTESDEPLDGRYLDMTYELTGLFKHQTQINVRSDKHQFDAAIEDLKVRLLRASQRFSTLQPSLRQHIDALTAEHTQGKTLMQTLKDISNRLPKPYSQTKPVPWFGIRQLVELPGEGKKDLTPELLNQKFLWQPDYFHYADWQTRLKAALPLAYEMRMTEDSFSNFSFFTKRRSMTGLPAQLVELNSAGRELTREEKDIISLTNLKHQLKTSLKDEDLVLKLLDNSFIDALSVEHLRPKTDAAMPELLPRDPAAYVEFIDSCHKVTEDIDKFTLFFRQKHNVSDMKRELKGTLETMLRSVDHNPELNAVEKNILKKSMIEEHMLTVRPLDAKNIERDIFIADLKSEFKIKTDARTLTSPRISSVRSEADYKYSGGDAEYLALCRCKAEAKLVKASLLKKIYSNASLTAGQLKYLQTWLKELKKASLFDRVLVPESPTLLKVGRLSNEDKVWLASFPGVALGDQLSLNDLVLELSHFIDEEPIRRFEMAVIEDQLLKEFSITSVPGGSRLVPSARNKEIWLITAEMEEYYWRRTGEFSIKDLSNFWDLYIHNRDHTPSQRTQHKLDWRNFTDFFTKANKFDFRLPLLKQCKSYIGYRRMEKAAKQRVNFPEGKFAQTDEVLHKLWRSEELKKSARRYNSVSDIPWENVTSKELTAQLNVAFGRITDGQEGFEAEVDLIFAAVEHPLLLENDRLVSAM